MTRDDWARWNGEYGFYDSLSNELVLTPACNDCVIIEALTHELTHWAEYMALTKEEREWESDIYSKLSYERSMAWMQNHHVCERLAYWMEGE